MLSNGCAISDAAASTKPVVRLETYTEISPKKAIEQVDDIKINMC